MPADSTRGSAATVERDPYACAICNCHHHTTEDHESREYVSRLWAEDWNSPEDSIYDD